MLKEKTLWYNYTVKHVPGRLHNGPDYMSRQGQTQDKPTSTKEIITGLAAADIMEAETTELALETGLKATVVGSISDLDIRAVTFKRVQDAVTGDKVMQQLVTAITYTPMDVSFPTQLS